MQLIWDRYWFLFCFENEQYPMLWKITIFGHFFNMFLSIHGFKSSGPISCGCFFFRENQLFFALMLTVKNTSKITTAFLMLVLVPDTNNGMMPLVIQSTECSLAVVWILASCHDFFKSWLKSPVIVWNTNPRAKKDGQTFSWRWERYYLRDTLQNIIITLFFTANYIKRIGFLAYEQ